MTKVRNVTFTQDKFNLIGMY